MVDVRITPLEENVFGVEVEEGGLRTGHRIAVPRGFLDDLLLEPDDAAEVAYETVDFLLDREPATALPGEFSVYDVSRDHDDYTSELIVRLGRGGPPGEPAP